MATTTQVREKIIELLQEIDGNAPYTISLAGGRTKGGKYDQPPTAPPFACVYTIAVDEQHGPVQGQYTSTGSFGILLWAAPKPKDPAARQTDAEELMDNARRALRSVPRLGGLVTNFAVSSLGWEEGQSPDKQSYPRAMLVLSAEWRES